jgi:predicted transcriptional regulator
MNHNKAVNQVLAQIPQLEEPNLTENQTKILEFLRTQSKPTTSKTVSVRLEIDYHTTRARLSELKSMGFVYQPNKVYEKIRSVPGNRLCGYSVLKL